jgi:hypothetical protein
MTSGRGDRYSREDEPFGEPTQNDPGEAVAQGEPYFPPTDPVVRTRRGHEIEILGGFGEGDLPASPSHAATRRRASSDEALADAVRAQLALDASTSHLRIGVTVEDAIVKLSGEVADLADAESAVAVAGQVADVADVIDDLRPAST